VPSDFRSNPLQSILTTRFEGNISSTTCAPTPASPKTVLHRSSFSAHEMNGKSMSKRPTRLGGNVHFAKSKMQTIQRWRAWEATSRPATKKSY